MTDFKSLKVSLTKHGAHKIALLLRQVEPEKLIENLWGKVADIKVEEAQAKKFCLSQAEKFLAFGKKQKLPGSLPSMH